MFKETQPVTNAASSRCTKPRPRESKPRWGNAGNKTYSGTKV